MGKTIIARGSPLAIYPHARLPWDDVWLKWTAKPARKTEYFAPTLMSRTDLEGELEINQQLLQKYANDPECDFSEDVAQCERLLSLLDTQEFVVDEARNPGQPDLYTSKPYINRAEATKMIRYYVEKVFGFKDARVKWIRPKAYAWPV